MRTQSIPATLIACALLFGCSAPPVTNADDEANTPDERSAGVPSAVTRGQSEPVGQVSEAIKETDYDTPAAGAVDRIDSTQLGTELWVFACDAADNRMKRRTRSVIDHDQFGQEIYKWSSWHPISTGRTCASAPTALRFYSDPRDELRVYWRDLSNELIEAQYFPAGGANTTDLSSTLGFGPILGIPTVADVGITQDGDHRVSVAVRKQDTDELYTLDFYKGRWHAHPILLATGATTSGVGNVFSTTYSPGSGGYSRAYIAMQLNLGAHMIYTRSSWSQSYTQFAWLTNRPPGVVTIGGHPRYCPDGCALYRDPVTNRPLYAPLTDGGDITALFKPMTAPPLRGEVTLSGSILTGVQPLNMAAPAFARASNGHMASIEGPFSGTYDRGGSDLRSAPVPASIGAVYAAGANRTLYYNSPYNTPYIDNLGLSVRAP